MEAILGLSAVSVSGFVLLFCTSATSISGVRIYQESELRPQVADSNFRFLVRWLPEITQTDPSEIQENHGIGLF